MLFTTRGLVGMPESHSVSCFVLVAKLGERMEATGGGGGASWLQVLLMDALCSRTFLSLYRMLRFLKKALETHTQTHISFVVGLHDKMSSVFGKRSVHEFYSLKVSQIRQSSPYMSSDYQNTDRAMTTKRLWHG